MDRYEWVYGGSKVFREYCNDFIYREWPGLPAVQHLVKDHSDRPHIHF